MMKHLITEVKKSTREEPSKESDIEESTELAEIDLAHTTYESDSQMSLTSESLKSNVRFITYFICSLQLDDLQLY